MSPRSFKVMKGHQQFSAITFDRDQLERCKHHRYVRADDTDRLICNITFSDHVDLDLRSDFPNELLMSNYSSFGASRQEKREAVKMNVVALLSQKLIEKKTFFVKTA